MSINRTSGTKSVWERIAGPQAFNPFSLILVSSIATIGTLSIYTSYDAQDFFVTLAILVVVQLFALLPIVLIAPAVKTIPNLVNRVGAVLASYVLVNVIRSILLDILLVNWGLETESRLAFRLYSNVVFLSILMISLAVGADVISDDVAQVRIEEEGIVLNREKLATIKGGITQARTYVSRELALEVSATTAELDTYEFRNKLTSPEQSKLNEFRALLDSVSKRLIEIKSGVLPKMVSLDAATPVRYSLKKIIDASTSVNPYRPGLMGGLSFIALAGWLGYFVDRITALRWAAFLGIYSFVVYSMYRRFFLPLLRKQTILIRAVLFEISLIPFVFFWLALLGFIAGDDSETYGIAAANSISVFIFANLATFVSGVLVAAAEYRAELEIYSKLVQEQIEILQGVKTQEENIWREFFAGDIAKSPTTATVRVRDAVGSQDGNRFNEVQPAVIDIWQNVLKQLSVA